MSYKIGIIGTGNVGVSYAYSLINQNLDVYEIVLVDINDSKAKGEALDLSESIPFSKSFVDNVYYGGYEDLKDADIVCVTAGAPQNGIKKSRLEDIKIVDKIIDKVMIQLNMSGFDGIILVASNPLDIVTTKIAKLYGKNEKVIGSGTLLDTARLRYFVAQKLGFPLKSISGYVFGEHGDTQFVSWNSVRVNNNISISDYLTQKEMIDIENKVRVEGINVAKLKGYTCFGVANALTRITRAIMYDEKEDLVCSTYDEEYGIFNSTLSKIGKQGVIENKLYDFDDKEKELYDMSCKVIKEWYKSIEE